MLFRILPLFFVSLFNAACATIPMETKLHALPAKETTKIKKSVLLVRSPAAAAVKVQRHAGLFSEQPPGLQEVREDIRKAALQSLEKGLIDEMSKAGILVEILDDQNALAFLGKEGTEVWVLRLGLLKIDSYEGYWRSQIQGRLSRGSEAGAGVNLKSEAVSHANPGTLSEANLKTPDNPVFLAGRLAARTWLREF